MANQRVLLCKLWGKKKKNAIVVVVPEILLLGQQKHWIYADGGDEGGI